MITYLKNLFDLNEPESATSDEWDEWRERNKAQKPIVYWLKEELPYKISIKRHYDRIRNAIRYRTTSKYYVINTKLKPDYYDTDTRLLHGMFSLLVDFIEDEKAHMFSITNYSGRNKYVRYWKSIKFFKNKFRPHMPEAGLAYLAWEMSLTGQQAASAKEQYELYMWWTKDRPNRGDPFVLSGLDEWYSKHGGSKMFGGRNVTDEQEEERRKMSDICSSLEKQHHDEDTNMLIRLIKIREDLWT